MDDIRNRLIACFSTVFPALPEDQIPAATVSSVREWDSVTAIALLNVVEEEFGNQIDFEDLAELDSFDAIANYLKTRLVQA